MKPIDIAFGVMACFFLLGIYAIYVISREVDSLRQRLKDAARRYEQLYAEYVRECAANPARPRLSTITVGHRDFVPGITMTQEQ